MTREISRRTFVKKTGTIAAGISLAPAIIAQSKRAARRKVNIAAIGIGGRGRKDIGPVADQNIVALCDVDSGPRAQKVFKK